MNIKKCFVVNNVSLSRQEQIGILTLLNSITHPGELSSLAGQYGVTDIDENISKLVLAERKKLNGFNDLKQIEQIDSSGNRILELIVTAFADKVFPATPAASALAAALDRCDQDKEFQKKFTSDPGAYFKPIGIKLPPKINVDRLSEIFIRPLTIKKIEKDNQFLKATYQWEDLNIQYEEKLQLAGAGRYDLAFLKEQNGINEYELLLSFNKSVGLNFHRTWILDPTPLFFTKYEKYSLYTRVEKEKSKDGDGLYDLDSLNDDFLENLRALVIYAANRCIVIQVTFFDHYSLTNDLAWQKHPWNVENHTGVDIFEGKLPKDYFPNFYRMNCLLFNKQKELITGVMEKIGNYPNVVYEIINEGRGDDGFTQWLDAITGHIKSINPEALVTTSGSDDSDNEDCVSNSDVDFLSLHYDQWKPDSNIRIEITIKGDFSRPVLIDDDGDCNKNYIDNTKNDLIKLLNRDTPSCTYERAYNAFSHPNWSHFNHKNNNNVNVDHPVITKIGEAKRDAFMERIHLISEK